MGVDYDSVGGIGVEVTEKELINLFKKEGIIDDEDDFENVEVRDYYDEWNDLENNPYEIENAGDCYSDDDLAYYLFIKEDIFKNIDLIPEKIRTFQKWLEENEIQDTDIRIIHDYLVW